ncbi:MAG: hypothetical protein ACEQR7_06075 [Agathobacter rectalis]
MKKLIPTTDYSFNAAAKTITFSKLAAIDLQRVELIVNATDGIIIYQLASPSLKGTKSTNVLTLAYDTTLMSNGDDLMIFYEMPEVMPAPAIGAPNVYSNVQGDFAAVANSGAKTVTLSAYANSILSAVIGISNLMNGLILRRTSGGVIDILPLSNATYSANVYTLPDMGANFAAGDTVAVYLTGPDKAYDKTSDSRKVTMGTGLIDTVDTISAKLATDAIMNDKTELIPQFYTGSIASSGNNTLIAAVSGKKIRVLGGFLSFSGTVNAKFQSGAGGTELTNLIYGVAGSTPPIPFSPIGWFETAVNTLLNLNLSASTAVSVCLVYVLV